MAGSVKVNGWKTIGENARGGKGVRSKVGAQGELAGESYVVGNRL